MTFWRILDVVMSPLLPICREVSRSLETRIAGTVVVLAALAPAACKVAREKRLAPLLLAITIRTVIDVHGDLLAIAKIIDNACRRHPVEQHGFCRNRRTFIHCLETPVVLRRSRNRVQPRCATRGPADVGPQSAQQGR